MDSLGLIEENRATEAESEILPTIATPLEIVFVHKRAWSPVAYRVALRVPSEFHVVATVGVLPRPVSATTALGMPGKYLRSPGVAKTAVDTADSIAVWPAEKVAHAIPAVAPAVACRSCPSVPAATLASVLAAVAARMSPLVVGSLPIRPVYVDRKNAHRQLPEPSDTM